MNKNETILITGATGNTGSLLVSELCKKNINVRVLIRDESKAKQFKNSGVEVFIGDLENYNSVIPAVEGADKIYLLTWNGPTQIKQAENLINAASQSGNPQIIRHSQFGSERSRIIKQHCQIEYLIKSSGLPWTILKPTFYMQNLFSAAESILNSGKIYWDMKNGKLSIVDLRDVVDAAVSVILNKGYEHQSYILTGPKVISFYDIADVFSRVTEREVKYENILPEESYKSMIESGLSEWIAEGNIELSEGYSKNFASIVTDNIELMTGRSPHSFSQFLVDHLNLFNKKKFYLDDNLTQLKSINELN